MKHTLLLRLFGGVLLLAGLALVVNPELVSSKPVPQDRFEAVERRIWWGLLIGFGALLQFHHQIRPWLRTLVVTCCWLLIGLLAARLIWIALDGSVIRQWYLVGIECVILAAFVFWYFQLRGQSRE